MTEVFLKLLNMSISATYIVLAVILMRLCLRRAPRWISMVMWSAVALRLVCPFSIESITSLIPSAETIPQDIVYAETPAIQSGISYVNAAVNPLLSESLSRSDTYSANPMQVVTIVAAVVWGAGMALMLLYTAVSYTSLRLKVRESIPYEGIVRLCDRISSPFILGTIRPRIYLPSNISEDDVPYVIAHEKRHLKRFDHIWKPLGFMILTVYWFNPILWVAYVLLCRDIEAACDEAVLKNAEFDIKRDYATALINCSVSRRSIAACPLAFGEVGVKARIKNVLSYKKPAFWLIIVGVVACAVLAVCFLTDPAGMKITEIYEDETGSQENVFDGVESITVYNGKLSREITDRETVTAVIEELKKVELKHRPISDRRDDGRDMTNRVQINDGKQLCFSDDYSEFWIYSGTKPTLSYKVMTPAYARVAIEEKSHLSSVTDYVETSGGTSLEDVYVMLQGVVPGEGGYIEVTFVNSSDKEITVGDKFELYRIVDGEQINCMDEDKMFDLLGYMLHAGGTRRYKYSLDKADMSKAGTYCFVTSFSTENDGNPETHEAWLEFSFPEGDGAMAPVPPDKYVEQYYLTGETPEPITPMLFLSNIDGRCVFTYSAFSSTVGFGTFEKTDGKLTVNVNGERFVFDVKDESTIIFNESASTPLPENKYSETSDPEPPFGDGAVFVIGKSLPQLSSETEDTLTFDIDSDGVDEECSLRRHETSGIFSFTLDVKQNGVTDYIAAYHTPLWGNLSFESCDDGEVRLKISNDNDGWAELFDITKDEKGYIGFINDEFTIYCSLER